LAKYSGNPHQKYLRYLRTHVGNTRFSLLGRFNYINGGQRVGTRTKFYPLLLLEDRATWTKLQHVLKHTGISGAKEHWSKYCTWICVKLRMGQGNFSNVKDGRRVSQGCCLPPILFNLYRECLIREAVEGFGDFKVRGKVIRTAVCIWPCADD
jgi:hypothetical protein